jgi:1-deoxyxylulose-5-phosphate synthase
MHSSEKIIGRWLKASGKRSRIVLQTKIMTNFTKQHIQEAIDASLGRLQTDWIDLYLFHSFDAKTPLDEGLEVVTRAVEQGKIRVARCSNFSALQLRESLAISSRRGLQRLEEVQPPYSLVERSIESDLLPLCAQDQIGVVAYSPLGAGFLSGKYERSSIPKGHSMVRLAMGWVLKKQGITSILVGASRPSHLENAIEALEMDFPDEWVREMDAWGASSERFD